MEQPCEILIRFHEIALKGKNRPIFVKALVENIRRATMGLGVTRVWAEHMLIRGTLESTADWEIVRKRIAQVPGAIKLCRAHRVPPSYGAIAELVIQLAKEMRFDTFRVSARRVNKAFPFTSHDLNVQLGDLVRSSSPEAKVNLTHPQYDIHVDVLNKDAFIYVEEYQGAGGLPVGTSGLVATLMSGGIDSPVAAWRMMKRGCRTTLIHFHSFPLVEGRSRDKAKELAELLNIYQFNTRLYLVPFSEIQSQMLLSVPGPLRVVLYRRFMLRIAESIARKDRALALVTGESLGQVCSQTLHNINTIDQAVEMPVLRPLVGLDKQEITDQARTIGTYETSIQPDEDCCSLFVPKSPATKASLHQVMSFEENLEVNKLIEQALSAVQAVDYNFGETPNNSWTKSI